MIPAYKNTDLPIETRVTDLVSRMTLEEKISQMVHSAVAIDRLDIPAYNWWNECLHGVARAGIATVFPQAIGLAATWNPTLMHQVAAAIADEARAKHHGAVRQGIRDMYTGLNFWSPNVNIFRDPRWGRGQETYGEDPYLTSRMAVAFIQGLQGDDPRYLKAAATPKHYAVHSGPESKRHHIDIEVSPQDLWETYLPAFEACVREANAEAVMGAYNRVNGEPCCASPTLLQQILRDEWGFTGHVVSDCQAIRDIYMTHQVVGSAPEAAALAVNAGCDQSCGLTYLALPAAIERGLISEETINQAVKRLFTTRFKLGLFDPPEQVEYAQIPSEVNDSAEHRQLALEAARQSIVLLKNEAGFLPLDRGSLRSMAVIGPNANNERVLWANYNGTASRTITPLEGIQLLAGPDIEVRYAQGCDILTSRTEGMAEAVETARNADVAVVVLGLSQLIEGEEGQAEGVPAGQVSRGDRSSLSLPGQQEDLLRQIHATGTPTVLVLIGGSCLAVNWAEAHLPAILAAWYPGEEGGTALAEILFGVVNPAGRLPITFYKSEADLPTFEDYRMEGRTYRYFNQKTLYPFGYGLSYSRFVYPNLEIEAGEDQVTIRAEVQNTGKAAGDEVVQLYLHDVEASAAVPLRRLVGFTRLQLNPGEVRQVTFELTTRQLSFIDESGKRIFEPGEFEVWLGGGQPDHHHPSSGIGAVFEMPGARRELPR